MCLIIDPSYVLSHDQCNSRHGGGGVSELVCISHGALVLTEILFDLLGVMVYVGTCHADQDCFDELASCRREGEGYANPFPWPIPNQDLSTACRCINSNII